VWPRSSAAFMRNSAIFQPEITPRCRKSNILNH
jgi:hypothetical protein